MNPEVESKLFKIFSALIWVNGWAIEGMSHRWAAQHEQPSWCSPAFVMKSPCTAFVPNGDRTDLVAVLEILALAWALGTSSPTFSSELVWKRLQIHVRTKQFFWLRLKALSVTLTTTSLYNLKTSLYNLVSIRLILSSRRSLISAFGWDAIVSQLVIDPKPLPSCQSTCLHRSSLPLQKFS